MDLSEPEGSDVEPLFLLLVPDICTALAKKSMTQIKMETRVCKLAYCTEFQAPAVAS